MPILRHFSRVFEKTLLHTFFSQKSDDFWAKNAQDAIFRRSRKDPYFFYIEGFFSKVSCRGIFGPIFEPVFFGNFQKVWENRPPLISDLDQIGSKSGPKMARFWPFLPFGVFWNFAFLTFRFHTFGHHAFFRGKMAKKLTPNFKKYGKTGFL